MIYDKDSLPSELVQVAAVAVAWLESLGVGQLETLGDIRDERIRQDDKWGSGRQMPSTVWLAILTEEVGEAAQAILRSGDYSGAT